MKFNFLTKEFFDKYKECLELEKKENRLYACTTLINCLGMTFAVPLRSSIQFLQIKKKQKVLKKK